jgi:hypothetical protein
VETVLPEGGGLVARPTALDVDSYDNIFIACAGNDSILKLVHPSGPLMLLASQMSEPQVRSPASLCVDRFDNVFIANGNDNILRMSPEGRSLSI